MDDTDKFLKAISQIESSGGKNTDHETMKAGPDKGMKAIGQYGITPSTFDTLIRKRGVAGYGPDEALMGQMDNEQLKDFIRDNPRVETTYARQNAERLLKKADGDQEKASLMWNKGANVDPNLLESENLDKDPYINKFRSIASMLGTKYAK